MILSKKTQSIEVIKNLCSINNEMYFKNTCIKGSSEDKHMVFYYEWKNQNLKTEFAIGNVNNFLSIIELYNKPSITENENSLCIKETDKNNIASTNNFKYYDKRSVRTPPDKNIILNGGEHTSSNGDTIKFPGITTFNNQFDITSSIIKHIQKQIGIIKQPEVKFENKKISLFDNNNSSTNICEIDINVTDDIKKILFKSELFNKIIDDFNYKVKIADTCAIFESELESGILTYIIQTIRSK